MMSEEQEKTFVVLKKDLIILIRLPSGDFDYDFSQKFRQFLPQTLIKYQCNSVILDFSNISMLDSDGIATLIYTLRLCSSKGQNLLICSTNDSVRTTMIYKGLVNLIQVIHEASEAIEIAEKFNEVKIIEQQISRNFGNIFGYPQEENMGIAEDKITKIKDKILQERKVS